MQKYENQYYLDGIKSGNSKVLENIYGEFLPQIKRIIIKDGGTAEDAEGIFNICLTSFFVRLQKTSIHMSSNFQAYLITACRNQWKKQFQKNTRERVIKSDYMELKGKEDIADTSLWQERWDIYEDNFQKISENCQKVLALHLKKTPAKIIMEELGYSSENVVAQRIFKCKKSLIEFVKKDPRYDLKTG